MRPSTEERRETPNHHLVLINFSNYGTIFPHVQTKSGGLSLYLSLQTANSSRNNKELKRVVRNLATVKLSMSGYGILDGTNSDVSSELFMRNVDYFDFPMESLEGDDLNGGYWDAKLQSLVPILSEVLAGSSLPSGGYIGSSASVEAPSLSDPSQEPELNCVPNSVKEAAREGISHQNNFSGGPVSVHGSRSLCSRGKRLPTSSEIFSCSIHPQFSTIHLHRSSASKDVSLSCGFSESNPPKTKTKPVRRLKKKKKLAQLSGAIERVPGVIGSKKCLHCESSETPQWRSGPMGLKTLCNACGVRYRSGHLFAEYRPAASPTFVPSLHSNIRKQIIEMRENVQDLAPTLVGSSLASGDNAASVVGEESSEVKPMANVVEAVSRSSSSPCNNYSGLDYGVLQTPRPVSAHQSSSSSTCSSETCVSLTSGMVTRSMRSRLSTTKDTTSVVPRLYQLQPQWQQKNKRKAATLLSRSPHRFEELPRSEGFSESNLMTAKENPVKRKLKLDFELPQQSATTKTRKCSHYETEKTPEWRLPTSSESSSCSKHPRFSTIDLHCSSASEDVFLSSGFSESNPPKTKTKPIRRQKKKKKVVQLSGATQRMQRFVGRKKCSHCESSETPQWRHGPMGQNTLCNACGVRYRSGHLFTEYRPRASPTFVPSLHSNFHKQVIEMRENVQDLAPTLVGSSLASGGNAASVVSNNLHAYVDGEDSLEARQLAGDTIVTDRLANKVKGMEAYGDQPYERSDVPLAFEKNLKLKEDVIQDERDDNDHVHFSSQQQLGDATFSKKRGKLKPDDGLGVFELGTSETPVEEMGAADVEIEPISHKKPFILITPIRHTGFSFSIIHLLSAVRMAMITLLPEDTLDAGKHLDKNDGSEKLGEDQDPHQEVTNGLHSHVNLEINKSEKSVQLNVPSLTVQEIVNRVRSNPGDPSILETQEPLQDLVRGVLKIFSSKPAPLAAKGWKPLVFYEKSTKNWSWIGPASHSSSDHEVVEEVTSPESWGLPLKMLVKLVDAFAKRLQSGQEILQQIGSLPSPPLSLMQFNLDEPSCGDGRKRMELTGYDSKHITEDNVETSHGSEQGAMHQGRPVDWEARRLNSMRENRFLRKENSANEDFEDEMFDIEPPELLSTSLL